MVQIKKQSVEKAILRSAYRLLIKRGYVDTSMTEIAGRANISTANLYTYFDSKLEIFFAIYEDWLKRFLDDLEKRAATTDNPRERLQMILAALWKELPERDSGFSNNLIQALARPKRRKSVIAAGFCWNLRGVSISYCRTVFTTGNYVRIQTL